MERVASSPTMYRSGHEELKFDFLFLAGLSQCEQRVVAGSPAQGLSLLCDDYCVGCIALCLSWGVATVRERNLLV
jgi:hypothetical protein